MQDDSDEQGSSRLIPAKTNDKGMPRVLPVDDDGNSVLPELDSKFKALVPGFVRQEMLRSWLTYWYRMFFIFFLALRSSHCIQLSGQAVNRPKASIPWAQLSSDPDRFIDPQSTPDIDGFQWMDPSKIRITFIDQLWEFYYNRIQNEDEPIVWLVGRDSEDDDTDMDGEKTRKKAKRGSKPRIDKGKGKAMGIMTRKGKDRATSYEVGRIDGTGKKQGNSTGHSRPDDDVKEEDFTKAVDAVSTDGEVTGTVDPQKQKDEDGIGSSASQDDSPAADNCSPAAWSQPEKQEVFLQGLAADNAYVSLVKSLRKAPVSHLLCS